MLTTIHIAIWGTALAMVCAVPCGLCRRETSAPAWLYQPVRRLMDACRAINEMVFAVLFIVVVGLGPFAGVLPCGSIPPGYWPSCLPSGGGDRSRPVEGVRATGANLLEEIIYGVIPQVLPCGSPIRCTALNPMCARPRWSAWSAPAASG